MSGNAERGINMGCNIHGYVEINMWHDRPDMGRTEWKAFMREPPLDRDYRVFAIFANVRKYDDTLPTITEPRGLPVDIGYETQALVDEMAGDGHSHSWLSAREIMDFSWGLYEITEKWEQWFSIFNKIVRVYGSDNVRFVFFFDN